MNTRQGKLIVIEGIDTSGKTTLVNNLKERLQHVYPERKFKFTREPGNLLKDKNNNICEEIRTELLTNHNLTVEEQAKLFADSRYYHTLDMIEELRNGHDLIVDRYIISSIAYQGHHLGFEKIMEYNKKSLDLLKEHNLDLNNIVLEINVETYNQRMSLKDKDAMECIDDEIVLARIINMCSIENINDTVEGALGKIYKVDANRKEETVLLEALAYINKILQ